MMAESSLHIFLNTVYVIAFNVLTSEFWYRSTTDFPVTGGYFGQNYESSPEIAPGIPLEMCAQAG